ncbi:hypothetical protein [Aeromicrobium massiliense]|uniref:hypothetical protein n=1 Tax=Aeromicrobium massiliense TaxID=1464554 RepID=UPI0003082893|nr:hypothetical protein [Aeromicrobium massiliense]
MSIEVVEDVEGLVKLAGTTTLAKDAAAALMARHGQGADGHLETADFLHREPDNAADPNAVAVHVEGERIAYLSDYLAKRLALAPGEAQQVQLQLFSKATEKGTRVVRQWADGEDTPSDETLNRLRLAYRAAALIAQRDTPQVAQAWPMGANPQLGEVAPARLLCEGELDEVGVKVIRAAEAFAAVVLPPS